MIVTPKIITCTFLPAQLTEAQIDQPFLDETQNRGRSHKELLGHDTYDDPFVILRDDSYFMST